MAGLQRSVQTFRRSGSSGMVWEERFLSGDPSRLERGDGEAEPRALRHSWSVGSSGAAAAEQIRNDVGMQGFRAGPVPPALDPPSPDVSGCSLCGIFGKPRWRRRSQPRRH